MIVEPGLVGALELLEGPVAYLDFETLNLPIPCWPGCHPYDQVPVQLSVHHDNGEHFEWIADSPEDPREELALALIEATRGARTIAAYNSPFERKCIEGLRVHLPHLANELDAIIERLVDLLPIVRDHVYHPGFNGSFSLKSVYPALVGRDGYDGLDVADGGTASVELERLMFDAELGEDEREGIRSSLLRVLRDGHEGAGGAGGLPASSCGRVAGIIFSRHSGGSRPWCAQLLCIFPGGVVGSS